MYYTTIALPLTKLLLHKVLSEYENQPRKPFYSTLYNTNIVTLWGSAARRSNPRGWVSELGSRGQATWFFKTAKQQVGSGREAWQGGLISRQWSVTQTVSSSCWGVYIAQAPNESSACPSNQRPGCCGPVSL